MTKTIEEEIKTKNFRSVHHKAALNIILSANYIHNFNSCIFKKYDLTGQQYNVLRILRGQYPNPCTILSIRERMLDKMSDASRIVERLRKAGYVDRILCENNRRAVDVLITKKGLSLLKKMEEEESTMDTVMKNLSKAEATTLNNLLDKLRT